MLKNLKKAAAIVLSFAMAVQFGLADSYYVNAVEEPVEPQQEETTTTAPQEQEEVPTTEEETPQQQEEEQQQPAVEEEQPAAEEAQPQPQPVEKAEVKVSYVKEDGTDLMESVTATYDVGYRLDQDTNVFKEAHEAFEFEYAFVNGNKENKITKDQVKASGLTVTSDMTSLTLVYKEKASTEKPKKANKQEPAKTETTSESDDASDADTTESQETAVQLTEFFVVASQNQVTKGETAQLTLTIKPDNYPNKDVTWSSSNEAIATVDGNGLVTTHEVGTVTITATLKSDPAISSSATIVVNPIKVSKITVNGYGKDYLVKGNTVTLTTTVEPSDAANKSIVWSSSNEEVATVDQNGKVTAVGQGTVSIKAMNDDSGVYGEQVITVYDNTPANYKVHVYVTNENQKTTYTINIPKDGTVVTPASVAQNTTGNGRTLVTKAEIRVLDELGSQPNWANISSKPIVTAFRYYNGKLQYKTTSNSAWATVGSNQRIYDFSNIQYKADETGSYNSTDVKVTIGDWPYGANASTSEIYKTIQIQVYNNETKKNVYDSGVMRYANGSNGNYGKVNFICDTSKYEVVKVERYFSNTSSSNYGSADTVYEGTIPSDLSVQFTSNNSYYYYTPTHEHYKFIAYVQAKTIHVKYDANSGTGAPKGTTVKSTEKVTVDSTTRPTREGYIFTGWAYGGKLYQGGESFDAPISDVTFVAQWAKASDVINYTVNDSDMGSVSRSYERIGETVQGNVQGSTAIAKTGYQFVKWVKGTDPKADAASTDVEYKPTTKGTYMAVFEAVTSDLVIRYVEDTDGKEISESVTKSYKYGESYTETAKEIPGYRLKSDATITGTKGVAGEEIKFIYEAIPVIVTIKGKTDSKEYTGNPQKVEGYDIESIKDDKGNSISGYSKKDVALAEGKTAVATGTDVGTYNMGLTTESFVNTNTNFKNVTFEVTDGWLKIDKKSIIPDGPKTPEEKKTGIKVTAPKDTTYSGNEQKREPVIKDTKTGKTLDKDDYSLSYSDDVTDAGTVTITVTGKGNYTGKFEVTYKILPRKVTLKSETASKPYDGTALTKPAVTVSGDGFVKGEVSDIKANGSVTTVSEGEVTNTITFTKENNYKAGNYTIVKDEGKLSIRAQSINPGTDPEKPNPDYTGAKVNSPSDAVYDGNEHKWIPTVTDKADKKLKAGTDYTVEYLAKNFKDVGTIKVVITGKGNYTGTVTRTYKITPKSVTVTANDKTKVFGETDPKLTATVDGTLGNDTVDYKLSREDGEAVGKYTITASGKAEQGNYSVTYVAGTLTITSQSIDPGTDPEKPNPDYTGAKVNSPNDAVYDGNEHMWSPTVTDKSKTLELGKDYTVEYSTKNFKDVGTIKVTITGIGNYSGTVKRSYKVTPKEYTVTTESATKTYSGTALTAGGKVEGIVSGETVEFTTTGSQIEVGTSKNTYELVWKSAKATNYTLVKESIGTLTVKAKSIVPDGPDTPDEKKTGITVSEPSDSKYDGKEHKEVLTVTDTKTGKELVAGTDYSVTYSSDLVNAGTVKVTVAGLGNYTGSFTKTYKITKRSVTLTSATVSKVYDGSALTNTSITVSGDGFVEGEGASYEVTGTQTEVGNSANAFEYKLNEKTLASNYNITKVVGTLTITAAPAPVTPATPSTPSTPSSTTSTTPRTPSAPQVTTPAETVEKETTPKAEPKKEEKVEEEYTPKASPQYYCALINLICAILTVLFGLLLLISKRHKDEDDDEDDDETKQQTNNDDEEKEQEKKRGLFTRVLAVLIAIVSVVFFLVTEDLSLPWTWTDQWTIWMVVIGLVQIVVFFVGRKWKNVDDDEDEQAQQA